MWILSRAAPSGGGPPWLWGGMRLISLLALAACKKAEPAPEDAEAAAKWLYEHYDDGESAAIGAAITVLHDDLDVGAMTDALQTTMTPLSADAVAAVGRDAGDVDADDPRVASGELVRLEDQQGLLIGSVIGCTLEDVEALLAAADQDEIHGGYDAYARDREGSGDAYFARETDRLEWTTDYTITPIPGSTYHATIHGGLRFVADPEFAYGDIVLGRASLPDPGVFESGSGYFRQDYQLDMLWERAPGETVHLFGLWRDLEVAGFHSSDAGFISLVSDRSVEADEEIAELCAP